MTEIKNKLLSDSTVVSLVSTYNTKPAIYDRPVIPEHITGNAISMYKSAPTDGGIDYGDFFITVNCYSEKFGDAGSMQDAVFNALNRRSEGDNTFFVASKLVILQPATIGGGDYNAPVEVQVKQR